MKATLKKSQAIRLCEFCRKYGLSDFFFAKDQGAYFGQNTGTYGESSFRDMIFYVEGCNPDKDEDWYENARRKFGGDDFGEHFELSLLEEFISSDKYKLMEFEFTEESISVSLVP